MPLNAFDASAAVFLRGLGNLKSLLNKAEAHTSTHAINPSELLHAQLADDMRDLAFQVHWAGEAARLAIARLLGTASAPVVNEGTSFAELNDRIDATIAHLEAVDRQALEAGLERKIEIAYRDVAVVFTGAGFLTQFAIPNFFFHLTTAYAILRHEGVPLTKQDFTGFAF